MDLKDLLSLKKHAAHYSFQYKSAILVIFHFWQNGTFEPLHEIQNLFLPKAFFWSIMKLWLIVKFQKMSQGPPKYKKRIWKITFVLGSYESLEPLEW
jgi:hypothetical protein